MRKDGANLITRRLEAPKYIHREICADRKNLMANRCEGSNPISADPIGTVTVALISRQRYGAQIGKIVSTTKKELPLLRLGVRHYRGRCCFAQRVGRASAYNLSRVV